MAKNKKSKKDQVLTTVVNKLKNYVVIILDKSGSMDKIKNEVVGGFNQNVEAIKKNNTDAGMETKVCLVTFSSFVDKPTLWLADINDVVPLTQKTYIPDGMTAMYDAVGVTVEMLKNLPDANDESVSFLVVVISDGQENNSHIFNSGKISELVTACEKTNRWTFTYVGANQDLKVIATSLNLSAANTMAFTADSAGYATMTMNLVGSTDKYYGARSAGLKSVSNLYSDEDAKDNSDKKDA